MADYDFSVPTPEESSPVDVVENDGVKNVSVPASSIEGQSEGGGSSRKVSSDSVAREFMVVLAFAYLPGLMMSVVYFGMGPDAYGSGTITPLHQLLYVATMAQMAIPLMYVFRLNNGKWGELGLTRPRWSDLGWGILVFVLGYICYYGVMILIYRLGPDAREFISQQSVAVPRTGPKNIADYLSIAAASLSIGFGEELLFRGYLISRWKRISGSAWQGVLISMLLFGINHAYQGMLGVIGSGVLGLVYAMFFVRYRRLWPLVLAHALTDFISLSMAR